MILFGLAMGGLFAVAYILVQRRTQTRLRPRVLALLVAGGGFLGLFLVPFLKYPANPPAIGHDYTIGDRSLLYLIMVVVSVGFLIARGRPRRASCRRGSGAGTRRCWPARRTWS